jgi:hypothetical protein
MFALKLRRLFLSYAGPVHPVSVFIVASVNILHELRASRLLADSLDEIVNVSVFKS